MNKKQKFRFTFDDTRREICNLELEFLKTEKWQKDGRNGKESQTSSCNTGTQRTPEKIKALGTTGDRWGRRLRSRGFRRQSVQGVIAPQIPIPFPSDRKPAFPPSPPHIKQEGHPLEEVNQKIARLRYKAQRRWHEEHLRVDASSLDIAREEVGQSTSMEILTFGSP